MAPFEFAELVVRPGEMVQSEITINPANGDKGSFIQVAMLHGYQEGPVLSLTAGIHGSEYSPILSMQEFPALLDPTKMSVTLVIGHWSLVIGHCAHRKSDFRGNEFFSPIT